MRAIKTIHVTKEVGALAPPQPLPEYGAQSLCIGLQEAFLRGKRHLRLLRRLSVSRGPTDI